MLATIVALILLAEPAPAQDVPTAWPEHREELEVLPSEQLDVDKAKGLYEAGVRAAEDNRWGEAIRFFAEAYRYSGRPNQLYAIGRSHRELYFAEGRDPVQLRLALLRFRQYLDRSPDGRSRPNAQDYIDELEPIASALEGFDEQPALTRLMVHSPVAEALVSVDGAAPTAAPITLDVEPGQHRVNVSAPGYREEVREVEVPEGAIVPIEVGLRALTASLQVSGPRGAELFVDGQPNGTLPLPASISLPAGQHEVAVALRGRAPFVRELQLGRGERRDVQADLPMTAQRKVAFAAIGVGAGSLVASATLLGLTFRAQGQAQEIARERMNEGISEDRFDKEQDAWRRRDALRTSAIATGVVGGVVLATGLILYFIDKPRLPEKQLGFRF